MTKRRKSKALQRGAETALLQAGRDGDVPRRAVPLRPDAGPLGRSRCPGLHHCLAGQSGCAARSDCDSAWSHELPLSFCVL